MTRITSEQHRLSIGPSSLGTDRLINWDAISMVYSVDVFLVQEQLLAKCILHTNGICAGNSVDSFLCSDPSSKLSSLADRSEEHSCAHFLFSLFGHASGLLFVPRMMTPQNEIHLHLFNSTFNNVQHGQQFNVTQGQNMLAGQGHLDLDIFDRRTAYFFFYSDDRRRTIHRWLDAPDPSSNHKVACSKRQPGTGNWFIASDAFAKWKVDAGHVWLHGRRESHLTDFDHELTVDPSGMREDGAQASSPRLSSLSSFDNFFLQVRRSFRMFWSTARMIHHAQRHTFILISRAERSSCPITFFDHWSPSCPINALIFQLLWSGSILHASRLGRNLTWMISRRRSDTLFGNSHMHTSSSMLLTNAQRDRVAYEIDRRHGRLEHELTSLLDDQSKGAGHRG